MKVIFKTDKNVSTDGVTILQFKEGDVVDLPKESAKICISNGWAQEVTPEPVRKFEPEETPEKPKKAGKKSVDKSE